MKLSCLTFHKDTTETDELHLEIVNVERDSEAFITLYADELNGKVHYFVMDQELLEHLKKLK